MRRFFRIAMLVLGASSLLIAAGCGDQPTEQVPLQTDNSWKVVEERGILNIGTSSGYPPYEYYTQDRTLTGFDIALINAVASKLGLRINIQDFAFDGLESALQVDQIDAAIAAITATEERAKNVNFSNIYFVGSDGELTRKGSPITSVKTIQDFANRRIGVERGTVYETWVQRELVDKGVIRADQMFVYAQAKDAVNDLSLDRLDLVIMDLRPANEMQGYADVVLVGSGQTQQRFAIAMKLNANSLTAKINNALIELQNDGTLAELQKEYLQLEPQEAEPLPTPVPTQAPAAPTPTFIPTPPPPAGCINSMKYIKDLTFDDGNGTFYPDIPQNTSFQKGWRIQNTGSCTWDSRYYLAFTGGTQMNGQPTAIQRFVSSGQTYDIYVNLISPSKAGKYSAEWSLFSNLNTAFGEKLFVQIEVIGSTKVPITATPTNTSIPQVITFTPTFTLEPPTITPTPTFTEAPPTGTPTETPEVVNPVATP